MKVVKIQTTDIVKYNDCLHNSKFGRYNLLIRKMKYNENNKI